VSEPQVDIDDDGDIYIDCIRSGNVDPRQVAILRDAVDPPAAARLRYLAAIYEQPLNRDTTFTFTGRELAAMLKEEG